MSLINREALYEKACGLEAAAFAHVIGKIANDETKTEEWKIWSAILAERTAFKHDIFDALEVKPEPHWIPCSERLPEEDGEYLVLYYTRSRYKPYVYDVISFTNDLYKIDEYDFIDQKGQKGWFYHDREYGFCEDNDVTAWMPLPEPYREDDGEK